MDPGVSPRGANLPPLRPKSGPDAERRTLSSITRSYKRHGYRVRSRQDHDEFPAFLGHLTPDLVAESDHDNVVIEVRRSDAVRGANDLVELAERVDQQTGWRLELVALEPLANGISLTAAQVASFLNNVREAERCDAIGPAYLSALALLEHMLEALGDRHGVRAKRTLPQAVRTLVFQGLVADTVYEALKRAYGVRDELLQGKSVSISSDLHALVAVCDEVFAALSGTTKG